jgi:pimeloyl-ACP methyl ester carboxylesterase
MSRRSTAPGALLGIALVLAGCGGEDPAADDATRTTTPSPSTSQPTLVEDTYDIGDGKHLYLECYGSGEPTVLFEAGDESGVSSWGAVSTKVAEHTRICGYDRLGVGASDAATGCREMDDLIADKLAVLDAAKVEGPYVLVGTSGGGYLSAEHAMRRPQDTLGIVIVDTFPAITNPPPDLAKQLKCDAPANVERRDYQRVEHAAWDHRHKVGNIPLVLISNDYGDEATNREERTSVKEQRGWFALSPDHRQVVVDTGHNVFYDQPDVVADAILEVLEKARS